MKFRTGAASNIAMDIATGKITDSTAQGDIPAKPHYPVNNIHIKIKQFPMPSNLLGLASSSGLGVDLGVDMIKPHPKSIK